MTEGRRLTPEAEAALEEARKRNQAAVTRSLPLSEPPYERMRIIELAKDAYWSARRHGQDENGALSAAIDAIRAYR